ncbi:class I SAM-dependent methyltransferase [bacterium]|nr:class I SAM-dependent methyltransferase [bacterium]
MKKEAIENHQRYLERIDVYKNFGYDNERERDFIIRKAQPIYGRILEIGTGKGHLTLALAKKGYSFVSVDISSEEQEFALLNTQYLGLDKQVDFKIEDAEHLNFNDNSFDIIVSVNVVHHLTNSFKIMDEWFRIISPGGKIVLSDFTREGLKIVDKVHLTEGKKHNVSKISLTDIDNYLTAKNFKIEKHRSKFQEISIIKI